MGRKIKSETVERPYCKHCNLQFARKGNINKNGIQLWSKYCNTCHKVIYNLKVGNRYKGYVRYKKQHCEYCGFIPIDLCQLDVDHIDGNRNNSLPENLQTLCANCHRLKTKLQNKKPLK